MDWIDLAHVEIREYSFEHSNKHSGLIKFFTFIGVEVILTLQDGLASWTEVARFCIYVAFIRCFE